ncbi:MAG: acetate/propionate family kinase [Bacteroidota bacterium]
MPATENVVLAINAGSSSVKFALYLMKGSRENVLFSGSLNDVPKNESLANWLTRQPGFDQVTAIAHRVVHGMGHSRPEAVTPDLIKELKSLISYDPEHLPAEIELMELFVKKFPDLPQFACFDTMFHQTMPLVAQTLAIPRKYQQKGIRRYGFHGISYQYLTEQLKRLTQGGVLNDRVIIAHLGSGASLAAIKNGQSIDTSMGFTPGAGIPMSTRSGDIDPGLASYLLKHEKLSPTQFNYMVNHEAGLMGVSETSADISELLKIRDTDNRAAEAVNLFCYQVSKYIGAYAAALGGLDTLVFSGGIGEHLPEIREQVCHNLGFLGIRLDNHKNLKNADIISNGRVHVRVMATNEALMMARLITRTLTNDI